MGREEIADVFLEQGLKELLYAFRKNGGDLEYCVKQIKADFRKAGYVLPVPDAERSAKMNKREKELTEVLEVARGFILDSFYSEDSPVKYWNGTGLLRWITDVLGDGDEYNPIIEGESNQTEEYRAKVRAWIKTHVGGEDEP